MSDRATPGAERGLIWLLRATGAVSSLALVAVFLPRSWMAASHAAMGLGPLPEAPIVDYLARTLSAFYAVHGALLLTLSRDVRRHRPLVALIAWFWIVFGLAVFVIDLRDGMPPWWTWSEGLPTAALGVLGLALLRRVES